MNLSLHWTDQFAIVDRVLNPDLDDTGPQKDVKNLQLVELTRWTCAEKPCVSMVYPDQPNSD